MKLFSSGCIVAFLCAASHVHAQTRITTNEIDSHLKFLSSDLLEGRAPGTRGGAVTEQYIASQLMAFGLQPGGQTGSYFQRVPIEIVSTKASTVSVRTSG